MWKWQNCHHSTGNWLLASNKKQVIVPTLSLHERKWLSNLRKFFASKDWSSKNWPLRPYDSMETHDSHPMRNNFWPWKLSIFLSGFQGEWKHSQLEEIMKSLHLQRVQRIKVYHQNEDSHTKNYSNHLNHPKKNSAGFPDLQDSPRVPTPRSTTPRAPVPQNACCLQASTLWAWLFLFQDLGWKYLPFQGTRKHIPPKGKAGKSSTQTYLWEGDFYPFPGWYPTFIFFSDFWRTYFGHANISLTYPESTQWKIEESPGFL